MNNESDAEDANDEGSNNNTITDLEYNNNTTQGRNKIGKVLKRKWEIAKMIIVGTRVSEKYGKLVGNPRGPNF